MSRHLIAAYWSSVGTSDGDSRREYQGQKTDVLIGQTAVKVEAVQ